MTTKELIQAELENLTEEEMNSLLHVIREMYPQEPPKKSGILVRLMQIKIDAPADFTANPDVYMYGGKKFAEAPKVRHTKRPSALGKYAYVSGGSEEFANEKQAEIEREDRAR